MIALIEKLMQNESFVEKLKDNVMDPAFSLLLAKMQETEFTQATKGLITSAMHPVLMTLAVILVLCIFQLIMLCAVIKCQRRHVVT